MTRPKLPKSVSSQLDALASSLEAMIDGEDRSSEVREAADAAVRAAWTESRKRAYGPSSEPDSALFPGIIAERLKNLRAKADWTQAKLGEAMEPYFPTWGRVTVAQIEISARRLSFEEWVVLAALFGVPAVDLLVPADNTLLELPSTLLAPNELRELLIGSSGRMGKGGLDWPVAMQVANEPTPRPASDLWRKDRKDER